MKFDTILRILRASAHYEAQTFLGWDGDLTSEKLTFYVPCNDFFYWGTADGQDITESTVDDWLRAFREVSEIDPQDAYWGTQLYCCRQRKMRPQGAFYKLIPQQLWDLFDACGPEREVGLGNPEPHPTKPDLDMKPTILVECE